MKRGISVTPSQLPFSSTIKSWLNLLLLGVSISLKSRRPQLHLILRILLVLSLLATVSLHLWNINGNGSYIHENGLIAPGFRLVVLRGMRHTESFICSACLVARKTRVLSNSVRCNLAVHFDFSRCQRCSVLRFGYELSHIAKQLSPHRRSSSQFC